MYETIKVEIVGTNKNVGLITLNRPKVLNALSGLLLEEVRLEDERQTLRLFRFTMPVKSSMKIRPLALLFLREMKDLLQVTLKGHKIEHF